MSFPILSKILKTPKTPKTPKTAATVTIKTSSIIKNKTQTSWGSYSNKYLNSPKESSLSSLDLLQNKVKHDLALLSTRSGSHILSSDFEGNLKKEMTAVQRIIELKQRDFNQIHHEAEKKEELLAKLKFELAGLVKENIDEPKSILNKRILEYNEITRALNNENYYIETLNHMSSHRKKNLLKIEPPVYKMKESLYIKKLEINKMEDEIHHLYQELSEISKNMNILDLETKKIENKKTELYNSNLNSLRQKQLLENILSKEYYRNAKIRHMELNEKMINAWEIEIDKAQREQKVIMRLNIEEKNKEFFERKFLKLREVASTNQVDKIFEDYETLKEHTVMLESAAEQYNNKIDLLSQERKKMMAELNEIILNHEADRKLNPKDFDKIEYDLKEKNKFMDENENILNNLGNIMGKICGSITRLSVQMLGNISIDVKPRNVTKYFIRCADKIEEKINFLYNYDMGEEEKNILLEKFPWLFKIYNNKERNYYQVKLLNDSFKKEHLNNKFNKII